MCIDSVDKHSVCLSTGEFSRDSHVDFFETHESEAGRHKGEEDPGTKSLMDNVISEDQSNVASYGARCHLHP